MNKRKLCQMNIESNKKNHHQIAEIEPKDLPILFEMRENKKMAFSNVSQTFDFYKESTFQFNLPKNIEWFDENGIHQIERNHFSDYMDKGMQEQYKNCRNYLVEKYRKNPSQYLSLTRIKKDLKIKSSFLIKLHSFLEHWGLINNSVVPEMMEKESKSLSDFESLYVLDKFKTKEDLKNGAESLKKIECFSCKKNTYTHYAQCKKLSSPIKLCMSCYNNGSFPHQLIIDDFEEIRNQRWPEEETQKIKTLFKKYPSQQEINWDEVAKMMAKSKEDCVKEYKRIVQEEIANAIMQRNVDLKDNLFMKFPNPILALLSFLNQHVDSAICSQVAVHVLREISKYKVGQSKIQDITFKLNEEDKKKLFSSPLTKEELQFYCYMSIVFAAKQSHFVARQEEEEIINLVLQIIDLQFKKIDLKLRKFSSLDMENTKETNKHIEVCEQLYRDFIQMEMSKDTF